MGAKGKHKISKWGLNGSGMKKHGKSGVPHNHANSIARTREYNRELEKIAQLKKKAKGKMFGSVKEALKDKGFG